MRKLLLMLAFVAGCSDSGRSPTSPNFNQEHGGSGPHLGTAQVAGYSWNINQNTAFKALRDLQAAKDGCPATRLGCSTALAVIDRQIADVNAAAALIPAGSALALIASESGQVFVDANGNVTQEQLTNHIVIQ